MRFLADLRLAARQLRRAPGYAAVAACTLALGIAATTIMFSVVERVLLRPLAFAQPDALVDVAETVLSKTHGAVSTPDLADWQRQSRSFSALGGYSTWPGFSLALDDRAERVPGARVSAAVLSTLGARPLLGRLFLAEEEVEGRDRVVVLGEALWRRRFGAAPDVVGRKVAINGEPHTVLGVLPRWLEFPPGATPAQLFVPLVQTRAQAAARGNHWMKVVGRLRPGVSLATAQAEMDAIARRLQQLYPDTNEERGVLLMPLRGLLTASVRDPLWLLFGAVGLLLAIACANVANLLLARAAAGWRETAVRTALGAGHLHQASRCLAEGLVLALLGVLAALPLMWAGLRGLLALAPADLPRRGEITLDGYALVFSIAAACATGLLFSLAPLGQAARLEPGEVLRAGARASAGAGARRLRQLLVVAELGVSLVLLAGAGLLLRSFWNLARVDPGFRTQGVLVADLALPQARYGSPEQVAAFYRSLDGRLATLPGVSASGMISLVPARDWAWNAGLAIVGAPVPPAREDWTVETRSVSPGYFAALGIAPVRGRLIGDGDEERSPAVVVINEEAARRFWPGADPVGAAVSIGGDPPCRVIGVVRSVHNAGPARPPLPEAYFPYLQQGNLNMTLVLRGPGDPHALAPALRRAVRELDRGLPLDRISMLTEVVAGAIGPKRFQAVLLASFAGLAVSLAAVGLYGLLAYAVVQRRQEFAVRMALGATAGQVRSMVLRDAVRLVVPGLAIGLTGAVALRGVLARLLFGIAPLDLPTLAAVALVLAVVALIAGLAPAERAVRMQPLAALREE